MIYLRKSLVTNTCPVKDGIQVTRTYIFSYANNGIHTTKTRKYTRIE